MAYSEVKGTFSHKKLDDLKIYIPAKRVVG